MCGSGPQTGGGEEEEELELAEFGPEGDRAMNGRLPVKSVEQFENVCVPKAPQKRFVFSSWILARLHHAL